MGCWLRQHGRVRRTFDALTRLVGGGDVVVLSGAGLSTESGIPDYRGPSGAARRHAPMTYQAFTGDPDARRRYWARSHLGWRLIARAAPNVGHRAVARLQHAGLVSGIITQNVDGLHTVAGSTGVVELHGCLEQVVCLGCDNVTSREELDRRLREANPGFVARVAQVNPDGDVDLPDEAVAGFRTVDCGVCGTGLLKPDVVFFGETVPARRVADCFALVERARAVLVLGSSLTVMSGRRFVIRAAKLGIPVAIVNQGSTRGDGYATVRLDRPLGEVLPALADRVTGPATSISVGPAGPVGAGVVAGGASVG
ncbi:NAD-dependent protein deacetylase [Micromonospora sp. NPDC048999]|uniref:NAD-dependent protein deacetylase n=1 Tax=Micromonospora sp. NPDC048999 TaxID=3155391 RepID=UPI00340CC2E1